MLQIGLRRPSHDPNLLSHGPRACDESLHLVHIRYAEMLGGALDLTRLLASTRSHPPTNYSLFHPQSTPNTSTTSSMTEPPAKKPCSSFRSAALAADDYLT